MKMNKKDKKYIKNIVKKNLLNKTYDYDELVYILNNLHDLSNNKYDYNKLIERIALYINLDKDKIRFQKNKYEDKNNNKSDNEDKKSDYKYDKNDNENKKNENNEDKNNENDKDNKNNEDKNKKDIEKIIEKIKKYKVNKCIEKHKKDKYSGNKYKIKRRNILPRCNQWIHEKQYNDIYDKDTLRRLERFNDLKKLRFSEQRSETWFKERNNAITASDIAIPLNDNCYEKPYKLILKKTGNLDFKTNVHCYHGKKYEQIATMIYEYRKNVKIEEFGLVMHSKYNFLGASPDGIVSKYKYNGINLTNEVGRMIEIKCPKVRKIKKEGEIKGNICPIYYWDQIQLQLECCDLDSCDFWQCNIQEYNSREEFIKDTDENQPYLSKFSGNEKGCVIQLLPRHAYNMINKLGYYQVVYQYAEFIYPDSIEMTPLELDVWISSKISEISNYKNYVFDKIFYWYLVDSHNVTIYRDKEWFNNSLPIFEKYWNYIKFYRSNNKILDVFINYYNSLPYKDTNKIMDVMKNLYNKYDDSDFINNIINVTKNNIAKKKIKEEEKNVENTFMFID